MRNFFANAGGSGLGSPVLDHLAEGCPTFAVFEAWLVKVDDQKNQKPAYQAGLRPMGMHAICQTLLFIGASLA